MNNLNQSSAKMQENQPPLRPWWTYLLPWLLLAILAFTWFLPSLLSQGGSQDAELVEIVEFLKSPSRYERCRQYS